MKFNKSLLVSTLVASSVLVAACNEKNKTETKPSEPAVATEQVATQEKVTPKTNAQLAEKELLNQFNNAVEIKLTDRQIGKNEQGEDTLSFSYAIENKGNKAIKELQWFNIVALNTTIVDVIAVPAVFEKPLAPQENGKMVLTKLAKNYSEDVRDDMLKPETNLQFSQTIAGKIVFEDGTELLITTLDDVIKSLQQIPKQ